MFAGINKAIDIIENRKEWYKNSGQPYYRPIIVLFSDGSPTNADSQIEDLDQKIQKMSDDKKFMFMPFGVGDAADMDTLGKLAAQTADQRLKEKAIAFKLKDEQKFAQVFAFVSASASAAMSGGGGATVSLDPDVAEAQRQLTASHQHFEFARQSYRKGYISQAEFEASDFDFQRAKKRLEMAKAADRPAELKELQLDIDTLDAQEDLALAKRRLKYATHIAAQGYPDQAAVEAHRQLVVDAETRLRELTGQTQTHPAAPPVPAPPAAVPPAEKPPQPRTP